MNKHCNNFLVFDFETGGLSPNKNPITEFAGIWLDGETLEPMYDFQGLVRPYSDTLAYEAKAMEINGLSERLCLAEGRPVSDIVGEILSYSTMCNQGKARGKKTILVGHNVQFDIGFLQAIFKLTGNDLGFCFEGNKDYFGNFQPTFFDTMSLSRVKHGHTDQAKHTLSVIADKEDVEMIDAHRAMSDVVVTAEIFVKYVSMLRNNQATKGIKQPKDTFTESFTFQF